MLTKFYHTELTIDFDAYRIIFTHNFLSVMFVFFIIVFEFSLDFVEITIFFEINDDQYVTKTAVRHVAVALRNHDMLQIIQKSFTSIVLRNFRLIISIQFISADKRDENGSKR